MHLLEIAEVSVFTQMPVLIEVPQDDIAVARLLDAPQYQALGTSIEQAMRLLKRKLQREIRKNKISSITSWSEAKLFQKSFPVQPAILRRSRRYPLGKRVNLPVRYVELRDQRDQTYLMLPDFDEILFVPELKLLQTILTDTVRSQTATLSPQEVARLWPATTELRWTRLRLEKPPSSLGHQSPPTLSSITEALDLRRSVTIVDASRERVVSGLRTMILKKQSCLLVGENGVGKTTMIVAAARDIRDLQRGKKSEPSGRKAAGVPLAEPPLGVEADTRDRLHEVKTTRRKHPQFWLSSAGRLIAGMRYLGQWQQRLEELIAELADIDGILIVENLLDLLTVGGREPRDSLAAFLIPYLRSGSLVLISEATPAELDACRRLLPELVDLLPILKIDPMQTEHETQLIHKRLEDGLQSTSIQFAPEIPATLSRLCRQFQRQQVAPGPSMRFVQELVGKRRQLDVAQHWDLDWLLSYYSDRTGLPIELIDDSHPLSRDEVAEALMKDVVGQSEACHRVAQIVTRVKAAVQDPNRPFGCLMLCGPTGVGKTQLAKSLSSYLFGSGDQTSEKGRPLTRLDMSEYSGLNAGYRFLNSADGNPANWVQQIRSRPLSVLLLDEIEKASAEVFDVLLSVLDEGRLTDRFGKVTSFQNTVILLTSNIGAQRSTAVGFSDDKSIDYLTEVRKAFKPEFFNRLDDVIAFSPLSEEVIGEITQKELNELCKREGLLRYGRRLTWSAKLVEHLTRVGFQSDLGARPLQQAIEAQVVAPLSTWMVCENPPEGIGLYLDWDETCHQLRVQKTGQAKSE